MGFTRMVLESSDGEQPEKGDEILVEYRGYIYDKVNRCRGKCFDSSENRRGYFKTRIGIGEVIKGWDEGIIMMKLGEKYVLRISSDYAYGEMGFLGLIPPNSTVEFVIQLYDITRSKTEAAPKNGDG